MTDHFKHIYQHHPEQYDRMVSREDQRGNLFAALMEIADVSGSTVVEFGAGTGRVTRILSVLVEQIIAFDQSLPMLDVASKTLIETGMTNWMLAAADNRQMPVMADCADIVIEGWSFGHVMGWSPGNWQQDIDQMLGEMARLLRPGGTAILIETMGTGQRQPQPPTEELATLYHHWETQHGFHYRWIRTDYQFASVAEADELTRFFFGDELADSIVENQLTILPECTGIWWKQF